MSGTTGGYQVTASRSSIPTAKSSAISPGNRSGTSMVCLTSHGRCNRTKEMAEWHRQTNPGTRPGFSKT